MENTRCLKKWKPPDEYQCEYIHTYTHSVHIVQSHSIQQDLYCTVAHLQSSQNTRLSSRRTWRAMKKRWSTSQPAPAWHPGGGLKSSRTRSPVCQVKDRRTRRKRGMPGVQKSRNDLLEDFRAHLLVRYFISCSTLNAQHRWNGRWRWNRNKIRTELSSLDPGGGGEGGGGEERGTPSLTG